jgi:hypothetical protein
MAPGESNLNEQMRVTIREYLVSMMSERDRLYNAQFKAIETSTNAQFKASETAVNAALAAQEKAVAAAFLASEKAIVKAEDAQKDYNQRSNEFRGQLDDQAKTLMPRNEAQTLFGAYDGKLEDFKSTNEKSLQAMQKDISDLRESRSASAGANVQRAEGHQTNQWVIGLTIGVVLGVIQVILHFIPITGK